MVKKNALRSHKRRGALTLEWILLVTVLVIGILGGMAAVRNATNAELLDLAEAISAINVGWGGEEVDCEDHGHGHGGGHGHGYGPGHGKGKGHEKGHGKGHEKGHGKGHVYDN